MQNKDLLLYFESFLSIISDWNPTNIVGYDRKVESMSNINISYKELKQLEEGSYQLLDMRDESNTSYGMIPGAVVAADEEELAAQAKEYLDQGKKVILYCTKGIFSKEAAENLSEEGIDVLSLEGGYTGWLLSLMKEEQENDQKTEQNNKEAEGKGKKKELTRTQEIEKSIRKKFHKQLFSKFVKAIKTYDLVQENDKIAICISGGKDSMLMAKLFQELKRHNKFHFDLVLNLISLMQYMRLRNPHVICVQECAADIYTAKQKNLDVIRSLWDITTTMLLRRSLWECFTEHRCRQ